MRYALVTLALAACAEPQRSSPPSPQPAPPTAVSKSAGNERPCRKAGDCIAGCSQSVATSCWRAAEFIWSGIGYYSGKDPYTEAQPYAEKACTAGLLEACGIADVSVERNAAETERIAAERCEKGLASACLELARRRPAKRDELLARAEKLARQECQSGVSRSCYQLAGMYGAHEELSAERYPAVLPRSGDQMKKYLERAIELAEAACDAGDAIECISRVWYYQLSHLGVQKPHPREWVAKACAIVEAGAGEGDPSCWHGDQPELHGYADAGRL